MVTLSEILLVYIAIVVSVIFYALTRPEVGQFMRTIRTFLAYIERDQEQEEAERQAIMDKLNRAIGDIKSTV